MHLNKLIDYYISAEATSSDWLFNSGPSMNSEIAPIPNMTAIIANDIVTANKVVPPAIINPRTIGPIISPNRPVPIAVPTTVLLISVGNISEICGYETPAAAIEVKYSIYIEKV